MNSLLDRIKKQAKTETVPENHPVKKLEFEVKFNYLRGLALFIAIDEKITDNEKSLWQELIKIFNCGEFNEQLEEFLEKPEISELKAIMASIKDNKVEHLFLLDALLICYSDADYACKEKELLEVFNGQLGIINIEIEFLQQFAKAVSEKDYQAIVAVFNDILKESIMNINPDHLDYFLEDFDERKEMERVIKKVEVLNKYYEGYEGQQEVKAVFKSSSASKIYIYNALVLLIDSENNLVKYFEQEIKFYPYDTVEFFVGGNECSQIENQEYQLKLFIDGKKCATKKVEQYLTECQYNPSFISLRLLG